MTNVSQEWLSPMGVATLLGVTHITVRNWIVSGKLGAATYKLGQKTAYAIYQPELRQLVRDNGYNWTDAIGLTIVSPYSARFVDRIDKPISNPEQAQAFADRRAAFTATYRPVQHIARDRNVTLQRMLNIVDTYQVEMLVIGDERAALRLVNLSDLAKRVPDHAYIKRNGRGVRPRDADYRVHEHVRISKETFERADMVAKERKIAKTRLIHIGLAFWSHDPKTVERDWMAEFSAWQARHTVAADKRYVADAWLEPCEVCTLKQVMDDLRLSVPQTIDLAIWLACQPDVLDWYLDSTATAVV